MTNPSAHHKLQALGPAMSRQWMDRAVCGGQDLLGLFFGPEGERQPDREVREVYATRVCDGCPARLECFEYALERRESGVWGGTTDDERASERRKRQRRAAAAA